MFIGWEYLVEEYRHWQEEPLLGVLNRLGSVGWELVSVEDRTNDPYRQMIFKRERLLEES